MSCLAQWKILHSSMNTDGKHRNATLLLLQKREILRKKFVAFFFKFFKPIHLFLTEFCKLFAFIFIQT